MARNIEYKAVWEILRRNSHTAFYINASRSAICKTGFLCTREIGFFGLLPHYKIVKKGVFLP